MLASMQNMNDNMTVVVKAPGALNSSEKEVWARLRGSNPALYSPYFHFGYTELVTKLRDDISVICVYEAGQPVAFLPVQGKGFARPAGAPMTDYQGFIRAAETEIDAANILKQAGIGALHFDGFVDKPKGMSFAAQDGGAVIDVSCGAETWRAAQGASYKRHFKNWNRKRRRAIRDVGEITIQHKCQDKEVFDTTIAWKRAQYVSSGKYDVLGAGWTLDLLEKLWLRGPEAELRVDMHVMYFDDKLAAVDMGLTDGVTYHSWMVTYNKDVHTYSPGILLLEAMIDAQAELGYRYFDLGVGTGGYKRTYCELDVPVVSGFVAASGPAAAMSKLYGAAESLTEKAPLGPVSKLPGKLRRRYSQIAACDQTLGGRTKAMIQAFKGTPK